MGDSPANEQMQQPWRSLKDVNERMHAMHKQGRLHWPLSIPHATSAMTRQLQAQRSLTPPLLEREEVDQSRGQEDRDPGQFTEPIRANNPV